MSTATLVNGAPFQIKEQRPQCEPFEFFIKPADFLAGGLEVFPIEKSKQGVYLDAQRGWMTVQKTGEEVAKSIVRDLLVAQIASDEPGYRPAIFWVPGMFDSGEQVKKQFADKVKEELECQKRWFQALVKLADNMWAKQPHAYMISDIHRAAALSLGVKRAWVDDAPGSMTQCPACFALIRKEAIVCYSCKLIVNEEKAKALHFAGSPTIIGQTVSK